MRVTDEETVEIRRDGLVGQDQQAIVGLIDHHAARRGLSARTRGCSGQRRRLHRLANGEEVDIGLVGPRWRR